MNDNVQVRIECSQCGSPLLNIMARYGDSVRMPTERERCTKCYQPAYGPLTVEIVAEALCKVAELTDDASPWSSCRDQTCGDAYRAQARFVISLLHASGEEYFEYGGTALSWDKKSVWRKWILDIARKVS